MAFNDRRTLIMRAVTWRSEVGELFDFNTNPKDDPTYFDGFQQQIILPQYSAKPSYYFLHQPLGSPNSHVYLLERRKSKRSQFTYAGKSGFFYKLVGGFKLTIQQVSNQRKVYIQFIDPEEIEVLPQANGAKEIKEDKKPYLIVRSLPKGLEVKKDQIIKLGKTEMLVNEVNLNKESKEKDITCKIVKAKQLPSEEKGECRYCLSSQNVQGDPLISLCNCKGSSEYQHINCLQQWLKVKLSKFQNSSQEGKVFHLQKLNCQICKESYPDNVLVNGVQYNLLPFLENNNPFIGLRNLSVTNQYQENIIYVEMPNKQDVNIGRLDSNNMIIPEDNSVSRLHGFFKVCEGDKIKIYDRMSKFGTLVYEKDKKVRVRENSLVGVEIGNTVFSFKLSEQG